EEGSGMGIRNTGTHPCFRSGFDCAIRRRFGGEEHGEGNSKEISPYAGENTEAVLRRKESLIPRSDHGTRDDRAPNHLDSSTNDTPKQICQATDFFYFL